MNWAPLAGAGGGYLLGSMVGDRVQAETKVPLVGLAGGLGGAYLAYRYTLSHPSVGMPLLVGAAGVTIALPIVLGLLAGGIILASGAH